MRKPQQEYKTSIEHRQNSKKYYYKHYDEQLAKRAKQRAERKQRVKNFDDEFNYNKPILIFTETNEKKIVIEDEYCEVWGCGEKLSREEKLFGRVCHRCFVKKRILEVDGYMQ